MKNGKETHILTIAAVTEGNTERNAGEPSQAAPKKRLSIFGGRKNEESESKEDKPKLLDRLKQKFNKDQK